MADIGAGRIVWNLDVDDKRFDAQMQQNERKAQESGSKLGEAFRGGAKIAGAALVGIGAAVTLFSRASTNFYVGYVQGARALARETGMTVTESSRLLYVTRRLGVDAQQTSQMFGFFSKQILATRTASDASKTAFGQLGVSVTDTHGKMKPFDELLGQVSDKFKRMPAGPIESALAMKLFGRQGKTLIPILNLGSAGIAKLEREADKLGLTLTANNIPQVLKFVSSQRKLQASTDALKLSIGLLTVPVLTQFNTAVTNTLNTLLKTDPALSKTVSLFLAFGGPVVGAAGGILTFVGNLKQISPALSLLKIGMAGLMIVGVLALVGGLIYLQEKFGLVTKSAQAIANAFTWFKNKLLEGNPYIIATSVLLTAMLLPSLIRIGVAATVASARVVASFARMAIGALVSAGRILIANLMTSLSFLGVIAQVTITAAIFVASWVRMAVVAMANAITIAAAWLIALGPIGWIIAAVIAVAAIIILNWDRIKKFVGPAAQWIANVVSAAWQKIKSASSAVWNAIKTVVMAVVNFIKSYIRGAVNNIVAVWNGIKRIVTAVSIAFNAVVNAIRSGVSRAVGAVRSFIGRFVGVGRDIVMGIVHGIMSAPGAIWNAIKSIAGGAWKLIKGLVGAHSPSKEYMKIGKWMMQGLAIGISDNGHLVSKSLSAVPLSPSLAGSDLPSSASQHGAGVNVHVNMSGVMTRSRSDQREVAKDLIEAVNEELRSRNVPEIGGGKLLGGTGA